MPGMRDKLDDKHSPVCIRKTQWMPHRTHILPLIRLLAVVDLLMTSRISLFDLASLLVKAGGASRSYFMALVISAIDFGWSYGVPGGRIYGSGQGIC